MVDHPPPETLPATTSMNAKIILTQIWKKELSISLVFIMKLQTTTEAISILKQDTASTTIHSERWWKGRHFYFAHLSLFASLFHKHNESYNIWSHLIGFVLVILSMVVIYYKISPELHTINIYSRGNCSEPISLYDLSKIFRELPARQKIE